MILCIPQERITIRQKNIGANDYSPIKVYKVLLRPHYITAIYLLLFKQEYITAIYLLLFKQEKLSLPVIPDNRSSHSLSFRTEQSEREESKNNRRGN